MEIDWQTVTFDFNSEENQFTSQYFEVEEQLTNQQMEPTEEIQPIQSVKRSRQEMEEEVFTFEVPLKSDGSADKSIVSIAYQVPTNVEEPQDEEFNPDDLIEEDVFEDDEDVILPPKEPLLKFVNAKGEEIYYCESCSLDFPTEAYLIRHQVTKKHKRALRMELRGKKVNQKRKYVRKNAVKTVSDFQIKNEVKSLNFQIKNEIENFQIKHEAKKSSNRKITDMFQIKQVTKPISNQTQVYDQQKTLTREEIDAITNLTPEEIELLHFIDDEIFQMESEKTAKNFYENFNFDLDFEDEAPLPKVKQFLTLEEIMADLIASSEPYLNEPTESKYVVPNPAPVVINLPILIPQNGQPLAQQQSMVQIQHQPLTYVSKPVAQVRPQPKVQQKPTPVTIQDEQPKQPKIHCQMCPRVFNLRCHLTQHMNIVHSGNRNLKCPKCGKKYAQQEQLDQHMEKHLGVKPFKCTKCVKSYNNKVDLKRHTKTHEEVKDFICKYCGGGFVRSDHLEKHLTIHLKHNRTELGDRIRSRKGLPLKNAV